MYWASPDHITEPERCELRLVKNDDDAVFWVYLEATVRQNGENRPVFRVVLSNITKLKQTEEALQKALNDEIRTLSGLIPICANCKNIRDDKGYWTEVETYIHNHSSAQFSHGICPECVKKLYPDLWEKIL